MKYLNIAVILTTMINLSYSQPTIQSSQLNPAANEIFTVQSADWLPEGNWGNNVTWDFSGMTDNATLTVDHASGSASFPSANILQTTSIGGQSSIAHIEASVNGQFFHGVEGGGVVVTYQDPMKVMSFPLNDAVYETNNFSATFISGGFAFTRTGTSQIFADAWGTIITPEGTFTDVMRVRLNLNYVDTYSGGTITYESSTYAWYKAGVHYALASVSQLSSDTGAPTQYSAQYLSNVNLGVSDESNAIVSIFPNPVSSQLTVQLEDDVITEKIEIYNSIGQLILSEDSTLEIINVDFSDLNSGIYFLRLLDSENREVLTKKIIRE